MKRRLFHSSIVAVLSAGLLLGLVGSAFAYSNDFDTPGDTTDWTNRGGTITQQPSGFDNDVYAEGIASASDGFHARLDRGPCEFDGPPPGGIGPSVNCSGPFTQWDGYGNTWHGPYQTQVDVYLDAAYAADPANEDSDVGNLDLITDHSNADQKGTRFDYTSAINDNTGSHLRDFGFVAGTGQPGSTCAGWVVNAQMNVNRDSAFPDDASKDPECIPTSGWYTFKHSFYENAAHNLEVLMEIIPVGGPANPDWTWTIESHDADGPDHIQTVGCNRYGWFSNQEVFGLPIDNASMTGGCAVTPHVGVIAPTATTCQLYRDGEAPVLEQLLYTTKGTKINAVSPGVFFYYTKVLDGTAGQKVDITEASDAPAALDIPINQGQVVLYDANTCKVVKWTVDPGDVGEATGTLPKGGDFIIGVKYNPSALKGKGVPSPTSVEYTFGAELNDVAIDEATVTLAPKG